MPARVPVGKSYSDAAFVTFVVLAVLGVVLAVVAAAAGGKVEAVAVLAGFGGLFALLAIGRAGSIVITAGASSVTFAFEYTFPLNRPDPLGQMLERVFNKLVAAAKSSILGGGRLAGDGWALDRNQFHSAAGKEEAGVPVREVAA